MVVVIVLLMMMAITLVMTLMVLLSRGRLIFRNMIRNISWINSS